MGVDFNDYFLERIFNLEADFNGFGSIYQYVHGLPMDSVRELLPVYDYLRDKDSGLLRIYPNNYPANIFLEDLNSGEKLARMDRVRGLNIIGKMGVDSTIDIFRVIENMGIDGEWEHGYPEKFDNFVWSDDRGVEYSEGDETVSNRSNNLFLNIAATELPYRHDDLPTESQNIIIKQLTGREPEEFIRLNQWEKIFLVRIFSPADFQFIDSQGRHIGKDFNTGEVINEIPGAFYTGFSAGPEFAVIPDPIDGEYKIMTQGTGSGKFDLGVSILSNDYALDSFINDIPVEPDQQDQFIGNLNTANGEPAITFVPLDQTPPEIIVNSPHVQEYLHSAVITVDYTVSDDESGIQTQELWLDGQEWTEDKIDLFYQSLGTRSFSVEAVDRMGNAATTTVDFQIIANLDSLAADINHAYNLGWIKNRTVRDVFLKIVAAAKPLYDKYQILKQTRPALAKLIKAQLIAVLEPLQKLFNYYLARGYLTREAAVLFWQQVEFIIKNL